MSSATRWLIVLGLFGLTLAQNACDNGAFTALPWETAISGNSQSLPPEPPPEPTPVACPADTEELERQMTATLDSVAGGYEFTYQMERADGRVYTYNHGDSSPDKVYESASTSKMITAMIILRLVDQGVLHLSDQPQDYLEDWPIAESDSLRSMTLEHLLSFRSGLTREPSCVNSPTSTLEECAYKIATTNAGNLKVPGSEFYYSGTHMQIAGLMAIKASHQNSWQEVFADFQTSTGLFPTGRYDLPSAQNPRLAGGMHWTGREYLDFLRQLKAHRLLSPELMNEFLTDHTASPVTIGNSPALKGIGEDWHYGLGYWHECQSASFDCAPAERLSSPGAFGAYPFWDLKFNYIGMLSIQTALGGFRAGVVDLERSIRAPATRWASCN